MLVMSVGMHLGFGILIAVYRLIVSWNEQKAAFCGTLDTAGGPRRACRTKGPLTPSKKRATRSFGRHSASPSGRQIALTAPG